ncbi:MAG: class I SAM-dependent methyltransferase [Alphaproteobacteria bacterium]|nr:class I SAM-dependent methyltransferase [Alphaproteobacteria bacterium]
MSALPSRLRFQIRDGFRAIGLEVSRFRPRGNENLPLYLDPEFVPLYQKYHTASMIPWQGLYAAYSASKHIALNAIAGAIVECGVWRGGCMAIMIETLARYDSADREFYLYDTFAGMAKPGEVDAHITGESHALDIYNSNKKDSHTDWCYSPLEDVAALMKTLPCAPEKVHLVKGLVEDTIPATLPDKISLLRLDTDWYNSTIHELNHMFPLLQNGGFLLVDDYGSWAGSKKAVDEYFAAHRLHERMFLNAVHGHGSVIGQLFPRLGDFSS